VFRQPSRSPVQASYRPGDPATFRKGLSLAMRGAAPPRKPRARGKGPRRRGTASYRSSTVPCGSSGPGGGTRCAPSRSAEIDTSLLCLTTQLSSGGGRASHELQKAYVPPPSAAAPGPAFATWGNRRRPAAWNHASTSGRHVGPVVREERPQGQFVGRAVPRLPSRAASPPMIVSYRGRPCASGPVRRLVRP